MTTEHRAPTPPALKVYLPAHGDVLRTPAGEVRVFTDRALAEAAAQAHNGFVQPLDAPSPGGFDRTWA